MMTHQDTGAMAGLSLPLTAAAARGSSLWVPSYLRRDRGHPWTTCSPFPSPRVGHLHCN
jgi:hypothetical protein